ncbi:MAG TPA: AAA family ATPase, partial [Candidatus Binatia bacterium]|nr:AAA family ATPase [Candidatus Binatia bacterium]
GTFVIERRGTETFFTSLALQGVEERVAQAVADQKRMATPPLLTPVAAVANSVAQRCGLNPEQEQALVAVLSAPLTVVTGGPGTGKSFFCSALAEVATRHQLPIVAAAPTGRAAQRLTELTGLPATTLHRLLEYQPASGEFLRTADFPLQAALVVVDEASMLDLFLFAALLAALPLGAKLVLIGDVDQLPSVGPGQVLADLIASGIAPVVRLTQLCRRTPQSVITVNAHRVRAGQLPLIPSDPPGRLSFCRRNGR